MEDYLEPGSLTWRQADELRQLLPKGTPVSHLSRWEAAGMIKLHRPNARWRREPPTARQIEFLRSHKQFREGMTRGEASEVIAKIIAEDRK